MNYANLIRTNRGFSLSQDNNVPTKGYMVSLKGSEAKFYDIDEMSDERLDEICRVYRTTIDWRDGIYFGAWVDEDRLYLDVSLNIQDRDVAIAFGRANEQEAIWSVDDRANLILN